MGTNKSGARMKAKALFFTAPREIEVREINLPALEVGQLQISTHISAISPGTEMLIYKGEAPTNVPAEQGHQCLSRPTRAERKPVA